MTDTPPESEEENSGDARKPLVVEPGEEVHLSSELHDVPRTGDLIWSEKHETVYECGAVIWKKPADDPAGTRDYVVKIRNPTLYYTLLRYPRQALSLLVAFLVVLTMLTEVGVVAI